MSAPSRIRLSRSTRHLKRRYRLGFVGEPAQCLIITRSFLTGRLRIVLKTTRGRRRLQAVAVFRYPDASTRGAAFIDTTGERIVLPAPASNGELYFPYYGPDRLYDLDS